MFQQLAAEERRKRNDKIVLVIVCGMVVSNTNDLSSAFRAPILERTFDPFPLLPSLDL